MSASQRRKGAGQARCRHRVVETYGEYLWCTNCGGIKPVTPRYWIWFRTPKNYRRWPKP